MKKYKTLLLTLALLSAAAAGCQSPAAQSTEAAGQESEITGMETEKRDASDGEEEDSEAAEAVLTLDQQLSRAILEECAGTYARGECAAEGHKILKTEEKDGETIVYALTMYGEYEFHNGDCFVKASGSGVIPAVITYQNSESQTGGNRGWQLQSFDWPEDGSEYVKSIERMFPEELWETCISPSEEVRKALEAQERDYAKAYLETLGREAEIGDYGDFTHTILTEAGVSVEVSNHLLDCTKELGSYPMWIGTLEKVEDGIRYIYEQKLDLEKQRIYYNKIEAETGEVMETYEFDSETGEMESARKVYYNTVKAIAAAQPGMSASGQIANPVKESSPEEFAAMGITLELPENEDWIQDVTYTTISDEIAQIQYYDAIAEADVTLRAGKGEVQELAGVYFSFDDSREEQWSSRYQIRQQYAVANGKTVGVLASWTDGELTYTMWGQFCGEGEYQASPIAKAAVYVAEHAGN